MRLALAYETGVGCAMRGAGCERVWTLDRGVRRVWRPRPRPLSPAPLPLCPGPSAPAPAPLPRPLCPGAPGPAWTRARRWRRAAHARRPARPAARPCTGPRTQGQGHRAAAHLTHNHIIYPSFGFKDTSSTKNIGIGGNIISNRLIVFDETTDTKEFDHGAIELKQMYMFGARSAPLHFTLYPAPSTSLSLSSSVHSLSRLSPPLSQLNLSRRCVH